MSNLYPAANRESRWARFWRRLQRFEEALNDSPVEILQRRVSRLEGQLAELTSKEKESAARAFTAADDRKSH